MEILIVVGTLLVCFALGVPIAYALGLGALAGAYWIGIPLEAVMLQVSSGVSKFAMLTIPFFVLAGAIMAEGEWRAAWSPLRMCWSGWSAFVAGCPPSTSSPRPSSAAFPVRRWPIPRQSGR
jgi:hypothetical protein